MAHKILTRKNVYDEGYSPNKVLLGLLIVGYICLIIYLSGYLYNLYQMTFVDYFGENVTIPSEITSIIMTISGIVYLVVLLLSIPLIRQDAKKLNVGLAYEKEEFFKSITWKTRSWGWLTVFFWWYALPLYLSHRKEIYRINKTAYDSEISTPLRTEQKLSKIGVVIFLVFSVIVIITFLLMMINITKIPPNPSEYEVYQNDHVIAYSNDDLNVGMAHLGYNNPNSQFIAEWPSDAVYGGSREITSYVSSVDCYNLIINSPYVDELSSRQLYWFEYICLEVIPN